MAYWIPDSMIRPFRATCAAAAVMAGLFLVACKSPSGWVHEDLAMQMVELERRTLADVVEAHSGARAALDRAVGYAIFANEATKVPVFGRGEGTGVAVDKRNDTRHFVSVTHFDVGGGLGRMAYRLVIVFFDADDFERLRSGTLRVGASIDTASAGKTGGFGSPGQSGTQNPKRAVYVLADSGATASWIVRLVRFKPLAVGATPESVNRAH